MNNEQMYSFSKKYTKKRLSPLKSIKAYCKEMCCCGDTKSWRDCTLTYCFLYRYRMGKGNRALIKKQHSTQQFSALNEPSGEK